MLCSLLLLAQDCRRQDLISGQSALCVITADNFQDFHPFEIMPSRSTSNPGISSRLQCPTIEAIPPPSSRFCPFMECRCTDLGVSSDQNLHDDEEISRTHSVLTSDMHLSTFDHEVLTPRCFQSLSTRSERLLRRQTQHDQVCLSDRNGSKKRKMTCISRSSTLEDAAVVESQDFTWKGSDEFSDLGDRSGKQYKQSIRNASDVASSSH